MTPKTRLWAGRVMAAVAILFLLFDSLVKVMKLAPAVDGTRQLGYPVSLVRTIGVIQLACLAVYLFPRTAVLGAVLLTGYLGGAVATHLRLGNPLFTHTLYPHPVPDLCGRAGMGRDLPARRPPARPGPAAPSVKSPL